MSRPIREDVSVDDLISRQAAIDALGERPLLWTGGDYELGCANQYDLDRLAIETVQPEQKWIPVTERLPKIAISVLLSEPSEIMIAEYHGDGLPEGLWKVDGIHHWLADIDGCAWMPLPKPYKEEQE